MQIANPESGMMVFGALGGKPQYHIENFFGMVRLGCITLLLRHI